jgi:predicted RNA-binding protein
MSLNDCLADEVRSRVESLDRDLCTEWGGEWIGDTATVTNPAGETYRDRTVVRSVQDALDAFEKYEQYAQHVLATFEPSNPDAVMLPCGANKPIGSSSIHRRKLDALEAAGYTDTCDTLILSEPCTIVPHNERLTLAAANYDFPPEYTDRNTAPAVHAEFAERVARFIDSTDYGTIYAYLPAGHWSVLESALDRTDGSTDVVRVPGASFNPETGSFCGDLMQSAETIAAKLWYTQKYATQS